MEPVLRRASRADLPELARHIQAYYRFEKLDFDLYRVEKALLPLLDSDELGYTWMVEFGGQCVGYAILCFGYSVEKGGRDGMIDEFFIAESHRRRGLGRRCLAQILDAARNAGLAAVFLEVAQDNAAALKLYESVGFSLRNRFCLMSIEPDGR